MVVSKKDLLMKYLMELKEIGLIWQQVEGIKTN